jgi:hypothetical protein
MQQHPTGGGRRTNPSKLLEHLDPSKLLEHLDSEILVREEVPLARVQTLGTATMESGRVSPKGSHLATLAVEEVPLLHWMALQRIAQLI